MAIPSQNLVTGCSGMAAFICINRLVATESVWISRKIDEKVINERKNKKQMVQITFSENSEISLKDHLVESCQEMFAFVQTDRITINEVNN